MILVLFAEKKLELNLKIHYSLKWINYELKISRLLSSGFSHSPPSRAHFIQLWIFSKSLPASTSYNLQSIQWYRAPWASMAERTYPQWKQNSSPQVQITKSTARSVNMEYQLGHWVTSSAYFIILLMTAILIVSKTSWLQCSSKIWYVI